MDSITQPVENTVVAQDLIFGKEWIISFEYKPNVDVAPNPAWTNIMTVTDGNVNGGNCSSRYPFVGITPNTNDEMVITSCVNDIYNFYDNGLNFTLENDWNSIIIGQEERMDDNGENAFFYYYKHNGVLIYETINTNPRVMEDMKTYISDPVHPAANGQIRNLTLESVIEWSSDAIAEPVKDTVIATDLTFGEEWMVKFEYKPNLDVTPNPSWTNIITFTDGNGYGVCDSRYPIAVINPNTNDEMTILSCVNDIFNYPLGGAFTSWDVENSKIKLENDWNSIVIGQEKRINDNGENVTIYFYIHNEVVIEEVINSSPRVVEGLTVYISDPGHDAANGQIKNLIVTTDIKGNFFTVRQG